MKTITCDHCRESLTKNALPVELNLVTKTLTGHLCAGCEKWLSEWWVTLDAGHPPLHSEGEAS